jgi:hypothetical protein
MGQTRPLRLSVAQVPALARGASVARTLQYEPLAMWSNLPSAACRQRIFVWRSHQGGNDHAEFKVLLGGAVPRSNEGGLFV